MQEYNTTRLRLRLGAAVLGLAGVLSAVGIIIANNTLEDLPDTDLMGNAVAYASTNYQIWGGLMIASSIMFVFGWMGLYLYLSRGKAERPALWGMLITVLGIVLNLPGWGIWSYAAPASGQLYLQGNKEAVTVYLTIQNSPGLTTSYLSLLVLLVGLVLLSVAVWRDNTLSRPAMIVLAVCTVLTGPFLPVVATIISSIVLALAGLWLAYTIWQKAGQPQPVSEPVAYQPVANQAGRY